MLEYYFSAESDKNQIDAILKEIVSSNFLSWIISSGSLKYLIVAKDDLQIQAISDNLEEFQPEISQSLDLVSFISNLII